MLPDKSELTSSEALILTIIGEARGEPIEGQVAVAWVIKNRLWHNPTKYKSYADVCFEHLQFSCWNDNSPEKGFMDDLVATILGDKFPEDRYLVQCRYIAEGVDANYIVDNTGGSLYYLTKDLYFNEHRPNWAKASRNATQKGNQVFFNV